MSFDYLVENILLLRLMSFGDDRALFFVMILRWQWTETLVKKPEKPRLIIL